ncbi:glycerophosphodiester phosphodiesterase [Ranunculus cassubicifolius]
MALKAVHVSDVPNLDHVPQNAVSVLYSDQVSKGIDAFRASMESPKFMVVGHRGSGMNMLQSSDRRMKEIKENTIMSFNAAGKHQVDFVEFDVQVTSDDCPVIFHDNFISSEENGALIEKRVTELTLNEFFSYGPQRESGNVGKSLARKIKDGRIFNWNVETDDYFCTLKEVFQKVDPTLGFNVELKFDDNIIYQENELIRVLEVILQVVFEYAKDRPIIFSSFQPDAARLMRKLQNTYPVFFLTNGGCEIYTDVRRNSLDEALKLVLENDMHGIVSEVKAIFRNPEAITKIKGSNLSLLTYGQLNNVPEAVQMQHLMGVDGVIVDLVREITEAVYDLVNRGAGEEGELQILATKRPTFSQQELSFLLRLIPQLIQH